MGNTDHHLRTRGWGPWRQEWYSICSLHRHFRSDCKLCQTGFWEYWWQLKAEHVVFKLCPDLWRWWANR